MIDMHLRVCQLDRELTELRRRLAAVLVLCESYEDLARPNGGYCETHIPVKAVRQALAFYPVEESR